MPYTINGELSVLTTVDGEIENANAFEGEMEGIIPYSNHPSYQGSVDITPSSEEQILETEGLLMGSNITIQPIPSNYGLITWNGSTLTVS